MARPSTALPSFYWLVFGVYEPALAIVSFAGVLYDPRKAHDSLALQSPDGTPGPFPPAAYVAIIQLGELVALLGVLNLFILGAARRHLFAQPAVQEKIVGALLTPLVFSDLAHLLITWWALGDERWNAGRWSGVLWVTFIAGISLFIPRVAWHLGVGRYVDRRDGQARRQ